MNTIANHHTRQANDAQTQQPHHSALSKPTALFRTEGLPSVVTAGLNRAFIPRAKTSLSWGCQCAPRGGVVPSGCLGTANCSDLTLVKPRWRRSCMNTTTMCRVISIMPRTRTFSDNIRMWWISFSAWHAVAGANRLRSI